MWTARISDVDSARGLRIGLDLDRNPGSYADVIDAWRSDAQFRSWFNAVLAGVSFGAFRWETPPVNTATAFRPFECVLLDSPSLVRQPDPTAFDEHFRDNVDAGVFSFSNLGRDAIMVVPRPVGPDSAYGHIAAFVRIAPEPQRDALWQAVGEAMIGRLSVKPVWLSTAGGGVSWLHVRLDDRPKYYGYTPYRQV